MFNLNTDLFEKAINMFFVSLAKGIFIILISYIVTKAIIFLFSKLIYSIQKSKKSSVQRIKTVQAIVSNLIKYTSGIVTAVLILINAFNVPWEGLVASVGIVGIVVGIGAQELIGDTVNGFFVIFEGTYDIGEYVKIGEYEGYVIELGIKSTLLETFEHEKITIPNSKVQEVINFSKNDYKVFYYFNTSYDDSIEVIEDLINSTIIPNIKELDATKNVEYLGLNEFKSSSISYVLAIYTDPEMRFSVKRQTNAIIKRIFDANNLEIPYENITISYKKEG